jgi:hypothetical protein
MSKIQEGVADIVVLTFLHLKSKTLSDSISQKIIIMNPIMVIAQVEMNRAKITLLQALDYWEA